MDPLDEWLSPPFDVEERGGYYYGRGVDDDKGGLLEALQVGCWAGVQAVALQLGWGSGCGPAVGLGFRLQPCQGCDVVLCARHKVWSVR